MDWNQVRFESRAFLNRHALLLCVVLAFFLRIGLLILGETYHFQEKWPRSFETGNIAAALSESGQFASPFGVDTGPTAWMMPGYPYVLALIFKVFGTYSVSAAVFALLLDCVSSALTLIPVFWMAKRLFDEKVALFAAILFSFYPPSLLYATGRIWDTTLFTMLSLFFLHYIMRVEKAWTPKKTLLVGLLFGITAFFKAIILVFFPYVIGRIMLHHRFRLNKRIKQIGLLTAMTLLILSPWLFRNYLLFDKPMLRSNFGVELMLGNNSGAMAYMQARGRGKIKMIHPIIQSKELIKYTNLGEIAYAESCRKEAVAFINNNRYEFLQLTIQRILYFWIRDLDLSQGFDGHFGIRSIKSALTTSIYILPLPFMLLGIVITLREKKPAGALIAYLFLFPLVYYITHVRQRYRFPIEPVMLIFASGGFMAVFRFLFHRDRS